MAEYNLTERQKDIVRWLVDRANEGAQGEFSHLVDRGPGVGPRILWGGKESGSVTESDLIALRDVRILTLRRGSISYHGTLLQRAFEGVSADFRPGSLPAHGVTINVSHSQIGAFNLGEIIGNIHATANGLTMMGRQEVAKALTAATEAITGVTNLPDTKRREAVEVIGAVGREVKEGRDGLIPALMSRLRELLTGTTAAYEAVKVLGRAIGYDLP